MENLAQRYMSDVRYAQECREKKEEHTMWQGSPEHTTRFDDGSCIRHCGGPSGGDVCYDEFGEEC